MMSLLRTTVQSKLPGVHATTDSNFITKGDFKSLTKDERGITSKYQCVIKTLAHARASDTVVHERGSVRKRIIKTNAQPEIITTRQPR